MVGKRLITVLFFLLPAVLFAQNKTEQLNHIRQMVKAINTDRSLKKIVLDNEYLANLRPDTEVPDNGEELTGYFKNGALVKMVYELGLSHSKKVFEFYFEGNKQLFVFAKEDNFIYNDRTNKWEYSRLQNVFEGRYYFDKAILIEKIEKGDSVPPTQEVMKVVKEYMSDHKKLLLKEYQNHKGH